MTEPGQVTKTIRCGRGWERNCILPFRNIVFSDDPFFRIAETLTTSGVTYLHDLEGMSCAQLFGKTSPSTEEKQAFLRRLSGYGYTLG